jgi:hypothetical protein
MQDMEESKRHWLELAEQLGLPPEPADLPISAPATPPQEQPTPGPTLRDVETEAAGAEPMPFHEPLEERAESRPGHESPLEIDAPAESEEEHRPQRVRRRGRRGGRRPEGEAADRATAESGDEVSSKGREGNAEDVGEDATQKEHSRRRGRGRSRRKKETVENGGPPLALDEENASQHDPSQSADEGPDDAEDDMSGWTIPSWQELIDSLYRPDR